jgi:Transposase IS116/IS110/IS902 family
MGTYWPSAPASLAPVLKKEFATHAGDGRLATNFYPRQIACACGRSGSSLASASASTPTCSITSGRTAGHGRGRVASVADPAIFKSGRDLAAWIRLVPRQNSSGGKERLGGITKTGNGYLRQMLMVGAMAVIRYAQRNSARLPWLVQLMGRHPTKVAAIALATRPPERCGR